MNKRKLWLLLAILIGGVVVPFVAGGFVIIRGVRGAEVPAPQVIHEPAQLCIAFRSTMGSGENVVMFTYPCCPSPRDSACAMNIYDQGKHMDEIVTIECPIIKLRDDDLDGFKEVYVTQDRWCKQFAHPGFEEPREEYFRIGEDGKFIEDNFPN